MLIRIENNLNNPLSVSFLDSNIKEFKKLIDEGANVNCLSNSGNLLIDEVFRYLPIKSCSEYLKKLLENDVFLGELESKGFLSGVISHCDFDCLKILLDKGFSVDGLEAKKNGYDLPIFTAIGELCNGKDTISFDKIHLLLEHNLDLSVVDYDGTPVLGFLIKNSSMDVVTGILPSFISKGCNLHQTNQNNFGLFHYGIQYNMGVEFFDVLLKNKVDINLACGKGNTPLMIGIMFDRLEIVDYLLKNKVDINFANNSGVTSLMVAADFSPKSFFTLLDHGADIFAVDNNGQTALHRLARSCCLSKENVGIFKKHKDMLLLENKNGISVLDIIKKKNGKKEWKELFDLTKTAIPSLC